MILGLGTFELSLIALAAFLGALVRGYAGFGLPFVALSFLLIVFPPVFSVILTLVLQVAAGLTTVRRDWPLADKQRLGWFSLACACGIPFGLWSLLSVDINWFRILAGGLVLANVLVLLTGWTLTKKQGAAGHLGIGFLSGFLHGLAALSGPPVTLYLMAQNVKPVTLRATSLTYFTVVGLFAIVIYFISGALDWRPMLFGLLVYPLLPPGLWLGAKLFKVTNGRGYKQVALMFLFVLSLSLIFRGYWAL
ncbi:MAG: sulfite exporter TauE/SafE family protein [Alphaproteobacteria bacterium]